MNTSRIVNGFSQASVVSGGGTANTPCRATAAFTLIELLVVIAIISLLSSVVVATLSSARMKARDSQRVANAQQLVRAMEMMAADTGSYSLAGYGLSSNNGNGLVNYESTASSSYVGTVSILSALRSKGLMSSDKMLDPLYGKNNYYLANCVGSSTFGVYLRVENSALQISSSTLQTQCGGSEAIALGMNYLVSAGGVGVTAGVAAEAPSGALAYGSMSSAASVVQAAWVSGFSGTRSMVYDKTTGSIYVAGVSNKILTKISSAGVPVNVSTTIGSTPYSMVVDTAGNVFTSNLVDQTISKVSAAGVTTPVFAALGVNPWGLAIDSSDNLYTANNSSTTVTKITPAGATSTYATGLGASPRSIIPGPSGSFYVACFGDSNIYKIPAGGGVAVLYSAVGAQPYAIASDSLGNLYAGTSGGGVYKINTLGVSSLFGSTGSANVYGVYVDSYDNVYTANYSTDSVSRITSSGVITTYGATGDGPWAVALDNSGNVYTVNGLAGSVSKLAP